MATIKVSVLQNSSFHVSFKLKSPKNVAKTEMHYREHAKKNFHLVYIKERSELGNSKKEMVWEAVHDHERFGLKDYNLKSCKFVRKASYGSNFIFDILS